MLGNPHYVFSLIVCFVLGFVSVLALPVGGPDTRDTVAMRAPDSPTGFSVHTKFVPRSAIPDEPPVLASRPIDPPSSAEPNEPFSPIEQPRSKWASPSLTKLVALASAPFPYTGNVPRTKRPFLNYKSEGRRGRKTRSGRVYWEDKTYSDRRALLHIPRTFDADKPGVMVLFFHGHGATLARDVVARQRLPAQIQDSGVNAVLVAPQFAVDARDSSAGKFWSSGGTKRFLDEVAPQLANLLGDPDAANAFRNMPVIIVGYSGGYLPTAASLANGGISDRVKGVVLLDGLYGEFGTFARWIERSRNTAFFLSAYATSTRKGNTALRGMLKKRGVSYRSALGSTLRPGNVVFVKAVTGHRDYVTKAWAENPISDVLTRLPASTWGTGLSRSASLSIQDAAR
ncbi:MAG: alpha/beta hydrolase [Hyphomicrobiaceae bacterium]|nr:alpha/beta hydrolase [Hyphomicrobiaceae bacterium]